MKKKLRVAILLLGVILLIPNHAAECYSAVISYETVAPGKESLSFINDSICIYKWCLKDNERQVLPVCDTFHYKFDKQKRIILYKQHGITCNESKRYADSINGTNMSFLYDNSPRVYGISKEKFTTHPDFVFPTFYEPMSYPSRTLSPIFYSRYGIFNSDSSTLFVAKEFLIWLRHPTYTILYPYSDKFRFYSKPHSRKAEKIICLWFTKSYEYLNYHTNTQKDRTLHHTNLYHTSFSYVVDTYYKEKLMFIDDSLCVHSILYRSCTDVPFRDIRNDTCKYQIENNLITIRRQSPPSIRVEPIIQYSFCNNEETISYSDSILFYAKIYPIPQNDSCTKSLIVKPYIDDRKILCDQTDSINAIIHAYFNVHVPLNY